MPDTFSAKQVANRIGTDAKTLRKFLRSSASPYEAVGQGGRYEFPKDELAAIKRSFVKWQTTKRPTTVPPKPAPKIDPDSARRTRETRAKETLEVWAEDPDREPTEEELLAVALEEYHLEIEDE